MFPMDRAMLYGDNDLRQIATSSQPRHIARLHQIATPKDALNAVNSTLVFDHLELSLLIEELRNAIHFNRFPFLLRTHLKLKRATSSTHRAVSICTECRNGSHNRPFHRPSCSVCVISGSFVDHSQTIRKPFAGH